MTGRHARWLALVALLAMPVALHGQTPDELLTQGIGAYRDLEMETAAWLLRRAARGNLPKADRARGLAFLGAAEWYRDRGDSASAAFERLIRLDPRFRLDPLVFAPEVMAAYDRVRRATPTVDVVVPPRVVFRPGAGGLPVDIFPSARHEIAVRIESSEGRRVRRVHRGAVADSARVLWDGRGAGGASLNPGLYALVVAAYDGDGRLHRSVEIPVRLDQTMRSSVSPPPRPALLPEREPAGPALIRLGLGVGAAVAAVIIMPSVTDATAAQIAVPGLLAAAGVIGFLERRPGRPYPDNVVANEARLAAWRARVAEVERENRARRPGLRLIIETGRPTVRDAR